jgi:heme exporter protein D
MPDLGKYAVEVGLAYGISLALIAALVAWFWTRSVRTRRALREVEGRRDAAKVRG